MKEGWTYKKLGEVIDHLRTGLNPRTHFKLNTPDAECYYITVRELKGFTINPDEKTDKVNRAAIKRINERSNLKIGDVLFSGTGTIGKTALVSELPENWNIKEGVYAMTPKHSELDSKYFIYYIGSEFFLRLVNDKAAGTGVRSIPMKELVKLPIPVPPLSEQRAIVARLDSAFAQIDSLKANAEKQLSEARKLFQKALEEAMTPKEGWEEKTIGEIFKTYSGGTPIKSHKEYYDNGDIPWIRSGEVCQQYITECEMFITEEGMKNSSAKYYPINTVLVAMYGATAAQVGILKFEATSNQAVCGILPNKDFVPEFIYYWFTNIQKELAAQAQGGAQPNISQEKIKRVLIPTIPLPTQHLIVTHLDSLSSHIRALEEKLKKMKDECDALKQAMLREVFE